MQGHICITASRMQIWPCMATAQVEKIHKIRDFGICSMPQAIDCSGFLLSAATAEDAF